MQDCFSEYEERNHINLSLTKTVVAREEHHFSGMCEKRPLLPPYPPPLLPNSWVTGAAGTEVSHGFAF